MLDFSLSSEERTFRSEVRAFFETDYPASILRKMHGGQVLTRDDHVQSQQALQSRGWLAAGWPKDFGGPGWTPVQRYIFDEELERIGAPNLIPMALIYIGPIICAFGSAAQQQQWLPDILQSRAMWCQGYSEPGSGSDLASLSMKATREGDDYILDGTKIWTSGAHWADWIFCLARTSQEMRKQHGISLICADMRSRGISVYPIISMDGSHELNRVVFDQVRVPAHNRIGDEGRGWHYANELLKNERLSYAHLGRKRTDLDRIRRLALTVAAGGGGMMGSDPAFVQRFAACEIAVDVLEISVLRALSGGAAPPVISALKIACTEIAQRITELYLDLAGRNRAPSLDRRGENWGAAAPGTPGFAVPATASYLFERAQTIYGGATEIQKNIIWKALGR